MNPAAGPGPAVGLRPATGADAEFRFRLFAGTRAIELAHTGWPPAQQEAFLRSQFTARESAYRASFPDARPSIVLAGRTPIGAMIVHRTAHELRLVDLALLPARRGAGLGTQLLLALIAEARTAGQPLRLQVLKDNPAARLYARLGFAPTGENGPYLKMEWLAPAG